MFDDEQFVFGAGARTPEQPKKSRKKAAPEPEREQPKKAASDPEPEPVEAFTEKPPRDQMLSQDELIAARADELEKLFHRLPAAGECPAPVNEACSAPLSGQEFVLARWRKLLSDPAATKLARVPADTSWTVGADGDTVWVRLETPRGHDAAAVARTLASALDSSAWGEYLVRESNSIGPRGGQQAYLIRRHAGGDALTPLRVAGRTAVAVGTDVPGVREQLFEAAGWIVRHRDGDVEHAQIVGGGVGPRGPEFVVDLPGGLSVEDAAKGESKLARLFRCSDLTVTTEGVNVRIRLNNLPAEKLPQNVALKPTSLYRPATAEQAVQVGKRIELPVGLTMRGGKVERVGFRLSETPHGLVVGVPGSGKSRWVRTAASAWAVQGGWLVVCDPKGGELVEAQLPGTVHIALSVATISRTLWWARTEMMARLSVQEVLKKRGISPAPFQPILVLVDEFGQMMTELSTGTDAAEKGAAKEIERVVKKTMQVGRSVGIHLVCISQNALVESIPAPVAQAAQFRFIAGRPQGGAGGSGMVDRLFPGTMKDEARELGDTIIAGSAGYALLDWQGKPIVAKTFYGYTPGEEPEDARFADLPAEILASWRDMRDALKRIPPVRRFGWKPGPDTPADWKGLSLFAGPKGDQPTVRSLQPVWLDGIGSDGRPVPIPEHKRYDPMSDEYEGGGEVLDLDGHLSPSAI